MSVKKPGGPNQGMSQNPLDSIMNADPEFKVNGSSKFQANANLDKEMQDESKNDQDSGMPDAGMMKSKGDLAHGVAHARQSTFLQDSGSKIKLLESTSDTTLKVAWNPKNHMLAFGGDKEGAFLWDMDENLENAQKINSLPHMKPEFAASPTTFDPLMVTTLDWKPDGKMFVTGASDGIIRLWNTAGSLESIMYNESTMPLKGKEHTTGAAYANNGTSDSGGHNQVVQGDLDRIYDAKWNKDGSALITVSEKNNVIFWNAEGKLRASYQGHNDSVLCVDWKNNNWFATAAQDGVIKIWDSQSSSAKKTFNAHDGSIKAISWDHAGALLASGGEDSKVKIWSLKHDTPLFTLEEHKEMITSVKWSPTGLGTGLENADVRLAS